MMQRKPILEGKSYFLKAITLILLVSICAILFSFLTHLIYSLGYGLDISQIDRDTLSQFQLENIGSTGWMQFLSQFTILLLPALIFGYLTTGSPIGYVTFGSPSIRMILLGIAAIISSMFFLQYVVDFNQSIELPGALQKVKDSMREMQELSENLFERLLGIKGLVPRIGVFLLMSVVPAVAEEILFRGTIQRLLTEGSRSHHWAIFVTAVVFSVIHFHFDNFLAIFCMGLILGYLYYWSGSLLLPMLAHFFFNGIQVAAQFSLGDEIPEDASFPIIFLPVAVIAFASFLFLFRRSCQLQSRLT